MSLYSKTVHSFGDVERAILFDTETTGLDAANSDIIEFSALQLIKKDGKWVSVKELDQYINPGYPIPKEITDINGITDEKVASCPNTNEALSIIEDFIAGHTVFIGHNVSFDLKFLSAMFEKCGKTFREPEIILDTLKMAKEKMPKPHKLIDCANRAGCTEGLTFHNSLDDCRATLGVLNYLLPMYDEEEDTIEKFLVTSISRWVKYSFDRIYVSNSLNATVYYDNKSHSWFFDSLLDEYDHLSLLDTILNFAGVSSSEEFARQY